MLLIPLVIAAVVPQLSHAGRPSTYTFSADHKRLFSCGWRTLKEWDLTTGLLVRTLDIGGGSICAVSKTFIAQAGLDETVKVRALDGKELSQLKHDGTVVSLMFSADGKTLVATAKDGSVRVWDPKSGKEIKRKETPRAEPAKPTWLEADTTFAVSPDARTIVAGYPGEIRVFDRDGKLRRTLGGAKAVRGAYFLGELVVSERNDGLEAWERASGKSVAVINGHDVYTLSQDGEKLFAQAGVYDVRTGQQRTTFADGCKKTAAIALSGDERTVLFGCSDGSSALFEASGKRIGTQPRLATSAGGLQHVALSRDGKLQATASLGRRSGARVIDLREPRATVLALDDADSVSGLTFNRSGNWLLTWWQNQLRAWDVKTGEPAKTIELVEAERSFYSPDHSLVVLARPNAAPLFLETDTLEARALPVSATDRFTFADDGTLLVSDEKTLRFVDAKNGRVLDSIPKPVDGVLSADKKSVLRVNAASIEVWDVASGVQVFERVSSAGGEWIVVKTNGEIVLSSPAAKSIAVIQPASP